MSVSNQETIATVTNRLKTIMEAHPHKFRLAYFGLVTSLMQSESHVGALRSWMQSSDPEQRVLAVNYLGSYLLNVWEPGEDASSDTIENDYDQVAATFMMYLRQRHGDNSPFSDDEVIELDKLTDRILGGDFEPQPSAVEGGE